MSRNSIPETAITDAELALMQVLWREGPLNARQITERLEADRGWHRKTVNTLLSRLENKSAVRAEKRDGVNSFTPLVDAERYAQSATSQFVDRLFGGKLAPLIASFAEQRPLPPDELAELRKLLEDLGDDS